MVVSMKIKKVLNNNAVTVLDENNQEIVVMGLGLAFKKRAGEEVDKDLIEKVFILKQKDASEKFKLLLEYIPTEHVSLCYDIIEYAKNILKVELNDYVYVTLTDHISHAIKLFSEGFNSTNALIWEIKKFYPEEFHIGLKALEFIESELAIRLPEDEAANIALHLINAQTNSSFNGIKDINKQTEMIQDILNIVKYTYNINLDEKSVSYERFITHLRYFFQRLNKKERMEENTESEDDFLFNQVKSKYKKAYECMLKIEKYLEVDLADEEKLYLTIHIQRVTQK